MDNSLQMFIQKHEKPIGSLASVLAILMFFSLVEILISNLEGRSNIYIQPLATALNGSVWSFYAYGKKDYYLLIPNVLAFVLGAVPCWQLSDDDMRKGRKNPATTHIFFIVFSG
jgi:hypothetical protein